MDDVNINEAVEPSADKPTPLFDNKDLFLLIFIVVMAVCFVVGWLFENWVLGMAVGTFIGAASGVISLIIRKK